MCSENPFSSLATVFSWLQEQWSAITTAQSSWKATPATATGFLDVGFLDVRIEASRDIVPRRCAEGPVSVFCRWIQWVLAVNAFDVQHVKSTAEFVAEGGEASVYRLDGLAYKMFKKKEDFDNELTVLRAVRQHAAHHPNIVELVDWADICIVSRFYAGGTLFSRMGSDHGFTWKSRCDVLHGISKGLQHLHCNEPQIVHADIKSTNVLIDEKGQAKLADFGNSVFLQHGQVEVEPKGFGTPGYCDPSCIVSSKVRKETDIYAMAMVILETLTRRPAAVQKAGRYEYSFEHVHAIAQVAGMLDKRGLWAPAIAQLLAGLAFACSDVDMSDRPTAAELARQLQDMLSDETLHSPFGIAQIVYPDGSMFDGEVCSLQQSFQPHGTGTHQSQAGHSYSGGWVCGRKSGRGRQTLPSGKSFVGEFSEGKLVTIVQRLA